MVTSSDKKLEILNDHYKSTVSGFKQTAKSRDTNFIIVLVLLGIMSFQFVAPSHSQTLLTQIINEYLGGIDAAFSINLLGSLVWLGLFFALVRYFQAVINLEKEYNYSHGLENLLSEYYGHKAFTKEGASYLNNYPWFSYWLHIVYRYLFPISLLILLTVKIWFEWFPQFQASLPKILDLLIYTCLLISVLLYVFSLRNTKKDTVKDVRG